MKNVLLISKPLEPPFNDGSKNLALSVALGLAHHEPLCFYRDGSAFAADAGLQGFAIGEPSGDFAPGLRDKLPILGHLLVERRARLHHYFFAPNRMTARAGRFIRAVRGVPALHTITSAPANHLQGRKLRACLFADAHIVLSRATEARLVEAGVPESALHRIPAFVPDPGLSGVHAPTVRASLGLPKSGALLLFPGDLEFGEGAHLVIEALDRLRNEDLIVAIAARPKTAAAAEAERRLKARAVELALEGRVHFLGEVARFHALVAAADVVALPSRDLYGKTDQPLALLEAMALGRPVLIASGSAAEELAEEGAALEVDLHAEAVAEGIRRLLSAEEGRLRGRASRALYERRFSPDVNLPRYELVYRSLLLRDD